MNERNKNKMEKLKVLIKKVCNKEVISSSDIVYPFPNCNAIRMRTTTNSL